MNTEPAVCLLVIAATGGALMVLHHLDADSFPAARARPEAASVKRYPIRLQVTYVVGTSQRTTR